MKNEQKNNDFGFVVFFLTIFSSATLFAIIVFNIIMYFHNKKGENKTYHIGVVSELTREYSPRSDVHYRFMLVNDTMFQVSDEKVFKHLVKNDTIFFTTNGHGVVVEASKKN